MDRRGEYKVGVFFAGAIALAAPAFARGQEPAAEGEPKTEAAALDEAGVESPEDAITRGLSWDILGGGVPDGGALIQAELGFSGLPRVSYHYTLDPSSLSLGGMVSFDYAYWGPKIAFAPSLLLQVPLRYSISHDESMTIGLRAEPGVGMFFSGGPRKDFTFGILLNAGATLGFTVQDRMIIGGGVDVPFMFAVGGDGAFVQVPILIGPIFEFHVTPPLAMTMDFKIGPNLISEGDTIFGFRLMAGVAYRM
jgi:hypothetical protein